MVGDVSPDIHFKQTKSNLRFARQRLLHSFQSVPWLPRRGWLESHWVRSIGRNRSGAAVPGYVPFAEIPGIAPITISIDVIVDLVPDVLAADTAA